MVLLALTACGSDSPPRTRAPRPRREPVRTSARSPIDPGDGTLLAGSGPTFFRVPPGATTPETCHRRDQDRQGDGHADARRRRALLRPGEDRGLRALQRRRAPAGARLRGLVGPGRELGADLGPRGGRLPRNRGRRRPDLRAQERRAGDDPGQLRRRQDVQGDRGSVRRACRSTSPSTRPTRRTGRCRTTRASSSRRTKVVPGASATRSSAPASPGALPTRSTARARMARSSSAPTAA